MNTILSNFLAKSIRKGSLEIVDAAGARRTFGDGTREPVRLRFT
jgi:cyclopropane-fatty-acyl-phospholipid synthase